jgi:hypothetical protein
MNEYYFNNRNYILQRQKKYNLKNREKNITYNKKYWMQKLKWKRNNFPAIKEMKQMQQVEKTEIKKIEQVQQVEQLHRHIHFLLQTLISRMYIYMFV